MGTFPHVLVEMAINKSVKLPSPFAELHRKICTRKVKLCDRDDDQSCKCLVSPRLVRECAQGRPGLGQIEGTEAEVGAGRSS